MNKPWESWTRDAYFRTATNLCGNLLKEIRRQEDVFCSKNATFEQKLRVDHQNFLSRIYRKSRSENCLEKKGEANASETDVRCILEEKLYQEDEVKYRSEFISNIKYELPLAFLGDGAQLELKCNFQHLLREKLRVVISDLESKSLPSHFQLLPSTHDPTDCRTLHQRRSITSLAGGHAIKTTEAQTSNNRSNERVDLSSILIQDDIKLEGEVPTASVPLAIPPPKQGPGMSSLTLKPLPNSHAYSLVYESNVMNSYKDYGYSDRNSANPRDFFESTLNADSEAFRCPTIVFPPDSTSSVIAHNDAKHNELNNAIKIDEIRTRTYKQDKQPCNGTFLEVTSHFFQNRSENEFFDSSHFDRSRKNSQPVMMTEVMPPISSLTTEQSPYLKSFGISETNNNVPKWLVKMTGKVPNQRLFLLALNSLHKIVESEALHKRHFFQLRKAVLEKRLAKLSVEHSTHNSEAKHVDDKKTQDESLNVLSISHKPIMTQNEHHSSTFFTDNYHAKTDAKADLQDLRHQLLELECEESVYENELEDRLQLLDRLANMNSCMEQNYGVENAEASFGPVQGIREKGGDGVYTESGVFTVSSPQSGVSHREPTEELVGNFFVQQSDLNRVEQQHTTFTHNENIDTVALSDERSLGFTESNMEPLDQDKLQEQRQGGYEIIQLEPKQASLRTSTLKDTNNVLPFPRSNDENAKAQRLYWFEKELQRYLWPAELEHRIRNSLHGYVRRSRSSWRPIIARTGNTDFYIQQKSNVENTALERPTTQFRNDILSTNTVDNRSRKRRRDAVGACSYTCTPDSQIYREDTKKSLLRTSNVVPRLPCKATGVILSVFGIGDFIASEVTFSSL